MAGLRAWSVERLSLSLYRTEDQGIMFLAILHSRFTIHHSSLIILWSGTRRKDEQRGAILCTIESTPEIQIICWKIRKLVQWQAREKSNWSFRHFIELDNLRLPARDYRDTAFWGQSVKTSIDSIIRRLVKVGAKVVYHARKWYVHIASAFLRQSILPSLQPGLTGTT